MDKPILFSAEMVRAILDGRKTMTRRLNKQWLKVKKGDRLWVRETWRHVSPTKDSTSAWINYKASPNALFRISDGDFDSDDIIFHAPHEWEPSIFMPRWASRITLEATADARLERLQEITVENAKAEGVTPVGVEGDGRRWRGGFRDLWDFLNPKAPWKNNPEVVVIEFKKCAPKS